MFDRQYYMTMVRRHQQQAMLQKQNMENALAGQARPPSGPGGVAPRTGEIPDSKLMSELVAYSVVSAAELQRRGVLPNIIQLVEHNRVKLREMFDQQRSFHNGVEQNSQNQASLPQRNVSNSMMELPQQGAMPPQNGMSSLGQPNPQQMSHQAGNHGMAQGGGTPANVSQQQQQQQQQQMGGNVPQGMMRPPMRPSPAQQQAAFDMVTRVKNECKSESSPPLSLPSTHDSLPDAPFPPHSSALVPDTQRLEYNSNFEHLFRLTSELDQKLPHYACVMKEDAIRKLVLMVCMILHSSS